MDFSPELLLIAECVRRALGGEGSAAACLPEERSHEWQQVLELSLAQGLAPLVYSGLALLGLRAPGATRRALRVAHLQAVARTEAWLEPLLRRSLSALDQAGIEFVVIKGAVLAYTAYRKPCHRTLGDIDLLLAGADVSRASEALRNAGIRAHGTACHGLHHIPAQYLDGCQLGVELHHDLLPVPHPYDINVNEMMARAERVEIAGIPARALVPTDALHLACVHTAYAHRYRWFPLRGLADILAITTAGGCGPDWSLLVATVRRSRTAGAVYWPLVLSRDWLGAPVPECVLESLQPSPLLHRLTAAIAEPKYLLEGRALGDAGSDVLYGLLLDLSLRGGCSPAEQMRTVLHGVFPPPRDVGHLPASVKESPLRFAAQLVRPARVARGLFACGRLLARPAKRRQHAGPSAPVGKREDHA
ncbi:MAG: nucleotidyltransferase domain-containing protein [Chloroflexota bacterium]